MALQEFGAGVVQGVHGDTVTVLFEIVGYTALATTLSLERGLLEVLGDAAMSVAS
ncbi:MAG TPA: hypothetical protein VGP33_14650 [Chloroflexota bacterium]|nr:hypothetical protein [Chloroflexota bacterium]